LNSFDRTPSWIGAIVWVHAGCFALLGIGCHVAPQAIFGQSAWIPMARLTAALLAAALLAIAVFLVMAVRAAGRSTLRLALLTALAFDVQVPIVLSLHPAVFEFLHVDRGIPAMLVPLAVVFGLAVPAILALSALKRHAQPAPNCL
jgi:hypothetical protein